MISDFLVQHPSGPFFQLTKTEWSAALRKYNSLLFDNSINFIERSATAHLNIGTDAYFDNDTVLCQFERLFQMLEFKEDFRDHQIELVVDNATTHTKRLYNINDFGMRVGTRCPVDKIEYIDQENGVKRTVQCYFQDGPHQGKSKGLLELSKELGISMQRKSKLKEIRDVLSEHPAFKNVCIGSDFNSTKRSTTFFAFRCQSLKN